LVAAKVDGTQAAAQRPVALVLPVMNLRGWRWSVLEAVTAVAVALLLTGVSTFVEVDRSAGSGRSADLLGFGVAAVELGRRLGVTKQAAAKYASAGPSRWAKTGSRHWSTTYAK
jgi:hypothetical protein